MGSVAKSTIPGSISSPEILLGGFGCGNLCSTVLAIPTVDLEQIVELGSRYGPTHIGLLSVLDLYGHSLGVSLSRVGLYYGPPDQEQVDPIPLFPSRYAVPLH